MRGPIQPEPAQPPSRGYLNCVLLLGSDVASLPVCRCLRVPASRRSILSGEAPSSSSRECGAGVRRPPFGSELSLRTELSLSLLQCACVGASVGRRVPLAGGFRLCGAPLRYLPLCALSARWLLGRLLGRRRWRRLLPPLRETGLCRERRRRPLWRWQHQRGWRRRHLRRRRRWRRRRCHGHGPGPSPSHSAHRRPSRKAQWLVRWHLTRAAMLSRNSNNHQEFELG